MPIQSTPCRLGGHEGPRAYRKLPSRFGATTRDPRQSVIPVFCFSLPPPTSTGIGISADRSDLWAVVEGTLFAVRDKDTGQWIRPVYCGPGTVGLGARWRIIGQRPPSRGVFPPLGTLYPPPTRVGCLSSARWSTGSCDVYRFPARWNVRAPCTWTAGRYDGFPMPNRRGLRMDGVWLARLWSETGGVIICWPNASFASAQSHQPRAPVWRS